MWLIKSIDYILWIPEVHVILFVHLFILNISNNFDYINYLRCRLILCPSISSASSCRRGSPEGHLFDLPSICSKSCIWIRILQMLSNVKPWEKVPSTRDMPTKIDFCWKWIQAEIMSKNLVHKIWKPWKSTRQKFEGKNLDLRKHSTDKVIHSSHNITPCHHSNL